MRWPLALLLVTLALVPASLAQPQEAQAEACRPPVLAVQQPSDAFAPGGSTSLLMSVENPNKAPVETVRASLTTTAPAGWTAIPAQREMTLGPQNFTITTLAVTAPNRGSGAESGNITLLVTFVCTSGSIQKSASASETIPVNLRAFQAPWPLVLGAFAVLAGGVGVLAVRRLRRGVALTTQGGEREVAPGKGVKFTFTIENRRGKPQSLRLAPTDVPEGWSLHLALKDVDLEPGEEKTLWAILKAPPHALAGTPVAIVLRLHAGGRDVATTTLLARVVVQ